MLIIVRHGLAWRHKNLLLPAKTSREVRTALHWPISRLVNRAGANESAGIPVSIVGWTKLCGSSATSHKEMTLGELFDQYVERHLLKKGKRIAEITASFEKAFSHWKSRRLSVIDPTEVMDIHQKIADDRGPLAANRAIEILRAMFNKAIKWRFFEGSNPATIVTMFPENARSRVLDEDEGEYERLQAALDREQNPVMRDFFLLALLTGARKSNLLAMRWKDINFTTGTWTIRGETTKTGDQYIVALTDIDLAILKKRMVSAPGECVFPGANASVIQGALNHKDIKTTMLVYAHTAKNAERDVRQGLSKRF